LSMRLVVSLVDGKVVGVNVDVEEEPRVWPLPAKGAVVGDACLVIASVMPGLFAPRTWSTFRSPLRNTNVGIAETLYREATSFAWSTSHFRKLTFVCLVERDSKCGAMA